VRTTGAAVSVARKTIVNEVSGVVSAPAVLHATNETAATAGRASERMRRNGRPVRFGAWL
jgi:hypothetical protein